MTGTARFPVHPGKVSIALLKLGFKRSGLFRSLTLVSSRSTAQFHVHPGRVHSRGTVRTPERGLGNLDCSALGSFRTTASILAAPVVRDGGKADQ